MSVLVIAEHENSTLKSATLNTISAAKMLPGDIHVLVAGKDCKGAAEDASKVDGVTKVLLADHDGYDHAIAENIGKLVAEIASDYAHILAPSTTTGKNIIPRAAALLDVQPLSDVMSIESEDTFIRPIYAGNVLARVKSNDAIKIMTVRGTAFDAAPQQDAGCSIEAIGHEFSDDRISFVNEELAQSDRPELTDASIVISGGRGLKNGDNFSMLYELADKLGAAVGASRAAVDAGYVPNDMQVGQTGKIVAPDLYIAVGISGAIQHLAGMKDSKVIVAINNDEDAPIFQVADYGLVADLFDAVPELNNQLG